VHVHRPPKIKPSMINVTKYKQKQCLIIVYSLPLSDLNMSHDRKVPGASRSSIGAFCKEALHKNKENKL